MLFPSSGDLPNPGIELKSLRSPALAGGFFTTSATCLVAQTAKNLPAMQEQQVQSLGREEPLEEGMATHSSILAWRILWTEEPGRLESIGSKREKTGAHASTQFIYAVHG